MNDSLQTALAGLIDSIKTGTVAVLPGAITEACKVALLQSVISFSISFMVFIFAVAFATRFFLEERNLPCYTNRTEEQDRRVETIRIFYGLAACAGVISLVYMLVDIQDIVLALHPQAWALDYLKDLIK